MSMLCMLAQAATQAAPATQAVAATQAVIQQTPPEAPGWFAQFIHSGLIGWYVTGGRFMVPLLICQIVGLGVIIERFLAYQAIRIDTSAFRARIKSLLAANQVDQAIQACDATPGPIAATLAVGLRRFKLLLALGKPADQLESDVTKAIDDYGVHILAILERHLPVLATIIVVGPLLGFLGTVDGMVVAFRDIEAAAREGGGQNIVLLAAAGIKVALLTTMLGLCIGIVAQLFYNYFSNRVNQTVLDVEESATELIQNLALMTAVGAHALQDDASR